jgi:hypothetical protein
MAKTRKATAYPTADDLKDVLRRYVMRQYRRDKPQSAAVVINIAWDLPPEMLSVVFEHDRSKRVAKRKRSKATA